MYLNQRLKNFMEVKNLSRNEFAEVMKVHPTSVSKWTGMEQEFPLKHIIVLCESYPDLNVRWFLTGDGTMLLSEQHDYSMTQKPTSPYLTECKNPLCAEKIFGLQEQIKLLREMNDLLKAELNRKVDPPEKKASGGVESGDYGKTG